MSDIVDVYDLDLTLLDTERRWFGPVLVELGRFAGLPKVEVEQRFAECNRTTFTFPSFFRALGIDERLWPTLERRLRADLASRANACLYEDVVPVLASRARVARLVLVTAGNEAWQRWKFDQLTDLHPFFAPEDRHFVPLNGSKADCIALYGDASRMSFQDDSPTWLAEARDQVPGIRLVRVMMRGRSPATDHPGDGRVWDVACSMAEIHAILRRD